MKTLPLILCFVVSIGAVPAFAAKTGEAQPVNIAAHRSHSLKKLALADPSNPRRLMNATAFERRAPGEFATAGGPPSESAAFGPSANESAVNGAGAFPAQSGLMSVPDMLLMLLVLVGLVAFQLRRAHDSLQRPFTNS